MGRAGFHSFPSRRSVAGSTDADAAIWAAAVTANSGTYSVSTLAAVSAFAVSAKASNYWTKLNRINLFCGNQLAAALVPLKVGGGNATETNTNFVAGDYTEATGITGNGTTKYLRTGLIASASLTLNDTHLAVYNRSAVAAGGGCTIGALTLSAQCMNFYGASSDGNSYSDQYSAAAELSAAAVTTPYSHMVSSRAASNSHVIYRNASALATQVTSAGTLPTHELYVFGRNNGGGADSLTSHPLAAYSIGSGLTAGDVTAYNTHMQTFQTALSRNV